MDTSLTLADLLAHWERGELTLEEVVAHWPHDGMSNEELLHELLQRLVGLQRRVMVLEGLVLFRSASIVHSENKV